MALPFVLPMLFLRDKIFLQLLNLSHVFSFKDYNDLKIIKNGKRLQDKGHNMILP